MYLQKLIEYSSLGAPLLSPAPDLLWQSTGVLRGLAKLGWEDVAVVACETEGADAFHQVEIDRLVDREMDGWVCIVAIATHSTPTLLPYLLAFAVYS